MSNSQRLKWPWIVVALAVFGLGISGYLWSAKVAGIPLICGESGSCDNVNASEWSTLFGIPVAAFGFGTYLLLIPLAVGTGRDPSSRMALAGFGLALVGALYSLYLTAIEAFVLHEYCIWCLVSWVNISLIAVIWGRGLWHQAQPEHGPSTGKAARKQRRKA